MEKIENGIKKLELINQWISNCDTKSSFILTFYSVLVTIIFTSNIGEEMIASFSFSKAKEINGESFGNFILGVLTLAFIIMMIKTFYHIYSTLKGRIDPSVYKQDGLNTTSNIFFGSISSKTFTNFENQSNNEDESTYLNDLNSQIFINANIVSKKFEQYNKSLFWMLISLGVFLFYVIFKYYR